MSQINNTDQNIEAIKTLVQALAYTQEVTILTKADPTDIASPLVPHYAYKKAVIEGDLRKKIEDTLSQLVDII
jgi:ribosomal protein S13